MSKWSDAPLGRWLFERRTWLPLPIAAALLLVPADDPAAAWRRPVFWFGALVAVLGESVRLWAVRHIGVISRTRSERLGPLVASGPFSLVRNPLYLGNILLWVGLTLSARLLWLVPVVAVLLSLEYHAIVRWEEGLLAARMGEGYLTYITRVPRWVPRLKRPRSTAAPFSWSDTLFSERGTLIAIAVAYGLLLLKG